jgi:YidC/Oxa1 family membrane protein insertase
VAELTERGGAFKTFKLKNYKETLEPNAPMKELIQLGDGAGYTPVTSFSGGGLAGVRDVVFRATTDGDLIDATEVSKDLSFSWTSQDGVTVTKTYSFLPDTYEIGLEIRVRNLSSKEIGDRLTLALRSSFKENKRGRYVFSGPSALINGELQEIDTKKIAEEGSHTGRITWAAIEDQYFVSAIIPEKAQEADLRLSLGQNEVLENRYIDSSGPVATKTERSYRYKLYFGPKSLEALGRVGSQLGQIVDFGWFDIIAKPLLHAMNLIYRYIPSYGIAIILITVIVKLLFWPLSNKSYQSMSQMKRLQPKMAEIRAKYKNDKKMMNQELMNLYKVYKVNPLGGCLPMVLQIPVFFAFYKMLYQAIELRHAPFCLWINDLSAPDRLFSFNFTVPLMDPPYGIPVLTLIMGASMFFQQKMSPPPGDPTQAKMMMFMPIFFTFIFINFPSGLVLYWLVNNILSMAQQYYITKKTS